jgi:hypothetical protein
MILSYTFLLGPLCNLNISLILSWESVNHMTDQLHARL